MITTDVTEEDLPLEGSLRPQTLVNNIGTGKDKKKQLKNIYRSGQNTTMTRWIMSCFMGHPVLVKQRYPESLPMKWGHT